MNATPSPSHPDLPAPANMKGPTLDERAQVFASSGKRVASTIIASAIFLFSLAWVVTHWHR